MDSNVGRAPRRHMRHVKKMKCRARIRKAECDTPAESPANRRHKQGVDQTRYKMNMFILAAAYQRPTKTNTRNKA